MAHSLPHSHRISPLTHNPPIVAPSVHGALNASVSLCPEGYCPFPKNLLNPPATPEPTCPPKKQPPSSSQVELHRSGVMELGLICGPQSEQSAVLRC